MMPGHDSLAVDGLPLEREEERRGHLRLAEHHGRRHGLVVAAAI